MQPTIASSARRLQKVLVWMALGCTDSPAPSLLDGGIRTKNELRHDISSNVAFGQV